MISDIQSALDAIVGNVVQLKHANGAGRQFELYIMTGVALELARVHRCSVDIQRSDGTRVGPSDRDREYVQRGGAPTGMPGYAMGPSNMSTLVFRLPGKTEEWEIWNGVQFAGRSGGTHEFDIAIVPAHAGQQLRLLPTGGTPIGRPRVAIECKDVQTPGSSDEMRALVARIYDVTFLKAHPRPAAFRGAKTSIHPGEPSRDKASQTFSDSNAENLCIIARRTGFRAGATAIAPYYRVLPHGPVATRSVAYRILVSQICNWIVRNL